MSVNRLWQGSKKNIENWPRRIPIAKIFISYRREDSADVTGRIHDRLVEHFGESAVFRDVDDIPLGVDFTKYIDEKVGQCEVLLAVVGRDWLSVTDANGNRRLDLPGDFVRIELESALKRNIPVVPLLVRRATMPKAADLPESIRDFAKRNGMPVRADPDFRPDCDRLIKGLEQDMTGGRPVVSKRRQSAEKKPNWKSKALITGVLGTVLISLLFGLYLWRTQSQVKSPSIVAFRANPENIKQGESTTLMWRTINAKVVEIVPNIGTVPASGTRSISPSDDITYTLIARGNNRKYVKRALAIQVDQSRTLAGIPTSRLSVAKSTIQLGSSTTLKWQTRNATEVEIQPGIGRVDSNGTITVSPRRNTTYTLRAKSAAGTATSSTHIKVERTLPEIDLRTDIQPIR
jgi:hypothetical protein